MDNDRKMVNTQLPLLSDGSAKPEYVHCNRRTVLPVGSVSMCFKWEKKGGS
jgi:hypothetical protein